MNLIGYIRVSTEKQVESGTPEIQGWAITEYCERNNYQLPLLFLENGRTGTAEDSFTPAEVDDIEYRPALVALFEFLREHTDVEGVIIHRIDRWARADYIFEFLMRKLKQMNRRLLTVEDGFIDTRKMRLQRKIRAVLAEEEADLIRERTMDGKLRSAAKGFFVGHAVPYGFKPVNIADDKGRSVLVPDGKGSEVVKLIYRLKHEGYSLKKTAFYLDTKQIAPPKGKLWSYGTVWYILHNPIYQGTVRYQDIEVSKPEIAIVTAVPEVAKTSSATKTDRGDKALANMGV